MTRRLDPLGLIPGFLRDRDDLFTLLFGLLGGDFNCDLWAAGFGFDPICGLYTGTSGGGFLAGGGGGGGWGDVTCSLLLGGGMEERLETGVVAALEALRGTLFISK
jgi:hypothetical protein